MSEETDVKVVVAEYPSVMQAEKAYDDLARWLKKGDKQGVSVSRVITDDGSARLVVAVVWTATGHVDPLIRRLKRMGGQLSDIPEPDKRALVDRFLRAWGARIESEQRGTFQPLAGPPDDPGQN